MGVLKMTETHISGEQQKILDGYVDGTHLTPEVLDQKLRLYTCHNSAALETYLDKIKNIDVALGEDSVWAEMEGAVRILPRSKGPKRPPRVVILGPRGIGVKEHASRLASRLGAVFVDGATPLGGEAPHSRTKSTAAGYSAKEEPSIHEAVVTRLHQPDCAKQGWVLCGFPRTAEEAQCLVADSRLAPTRVVALIAQFDTCMKRLRLNMTDTVTNKVWTSMPSNPEVRKRLKRRDEDQPAAVMSMHQSFTMSLPDILDVLAGEDTDTGKVTRIPADGKPYDVFREVTEFVERPRPHQPI